MKRIIAISALFMALLVIAPGLSNVALAHCDTMDGPVVTAAQRALEVQDANLVLIWVQPQDEAELVAAFQQALTVRKLSPEAQTLADKYFFETLVRLHRAGEGAPYTGLKPAGQELEPGIAAADEALATGQVEPLLQLVAGVVESGVRDQFDEVISQRSFDKSDVAAGRAYVKAYVEFIHYVERIYEAASQPAEGHFVEAAQPQTAVQHEEAQTAIPHDETPVESEQRPSASTPPGWMLVAGVVVAVALLVLLLRAR